MSAVRLTPGVIVVLTSVLGATMQVSSPAPASGGRISGQVATSYGSFVADAMVTLTPTNQPGLRIGPRSVQSGSKGEFSFDQLPVGRYRLSASKDGFTSRQPVTPGEVGIRGDQAMQFRTGPEVTLDEGQFVTGVGVVIHRSAGIAGRIIRPDGSAAAGVEVAAARRVAGSQPRLLPETSTNSEWDGRYEITDLPPGEYLVSARVGLRLVNEPQGSSPTAATGTAGLRRIDPQEAVRVTLYPGVPDTEPGELVTLFEGVRAEGIDIWLTPAQRFSVSGRVFWPVGVAPGAISIDFGDPAGTRSGVWYLSDPGGLFTLMGIPPGPLTVLARAESDQGPLLGLATTIVAVDSVEDVRVVVDRPGTVSGRVVYEGGGGARGNRATSIVLVQKLLKVSALYPVPEAPLGQDGRFEIREALGEYEIELRGLPSGLTITRILRGGVALRANRIAVAGGETVDDLEVVVAAR